MKNTLIRLAITALALLCVLIPCVSVLADTPLNVTFLGDSIASGYGLENLSDSYAAIVSQTKKYSAGNYAVPGHKTTDLLDLVKNNDTVQAGIIESDIIFISIGGNDIINMLQNATMTQLFDIMQNGADSAYVKAAAAALETALSNICTEIRALNSDCTIIFQTQYNPLYANAQYASYADTVDSFAPVFNSFFYTLSQTYDGVYVADVYTAFDNYYTAEGNYDIIHPDGIHPSKEGHQLIAQVLLEELTALEAQGIIPTETTPPTKKYYLLGDVDGSGKVNISDATTIQKHIAGILIFDEIATLCADSDQSTSVNVKDATAIQKYLADLLPDSLINTLIEY